MVTMNGNDRHLFSAGAPGKRAVALEIPRAHVVTRDRSQPGFDGGTLLLAPWLAVAMASGPPAFVNSMVRRGISRQAFGTERFSSPAR
jgi:hypothetical protein